MRFILVFFIFIKLAYADVPDLSDLREALPIKKEPSPAPVIPPAPPKTRIVIPPKPKPPAPKGN